MAETISQPTAPATAAATYHHQLAKTDVTVYVPFYDDDLFKPVALASRYEHCSHYDLLVP